MGCRGRVSPWEGPGALDTLERKRLHVKQSMDQVLNTVKVHYQSDPHSHTLAHSRCPSPPEPTSRFGEYLLDPTTFNNSITR
jgi:hypothetical protein